MNYHPPTLQCPTRKCLYCITGTQHDWPNLASGRWLAMLTASFAICQCDRVGKHSSSIQDSRSDCLILHFSSGLLVSPRMHFSILLLPYPWFLGALLLGLYDADCLGSMLLCESGSSNETEALPETKLSLKGATATAGNQVATAMWKVSFLCELVERGRLLWELLQSLDLNFLLYPESAYWISFYILI